ncbi:MAG: tRNA lysidine(34) synthetase TilS [Bacilli bacterium]|nr:tRNA lysidine(34) synthetase TilS [Bacilli bacterium]
MDRVKKFIEKEIKNDSSVVVACSGGPDSMCLLSLINEYKDNKHLKIICAHVNHKLRSVSDDEELFVKNYAVSLGIEFISVQFDDFQNKKVNEDMARRRRYSFLFDVVKKYHANYLVTAHHGDDLVETVLMRLTRGSNLSGYAGIKEKSIKDGVVILRPLLSVDKQHLINYNEEHGIKFVTDASNLSLDFTRNRYRLQVLPFLKKEDIHVHEKYLQFSRELFMYHEFVNQYIVEKQFIVDNQIIINKIENETEFIKRKTIELLIHKIQQTDWLDISQSQVDEILKLLSGRNRTIHLNNGFQCIKDYNILTIKKSEDYVNYAYILIDKVEHDDWVIESFSLFDDFSNNMIALSSSDIVLPLVVRNRKEGDFIEVKNLHGKKKLKDIFIDEKISLEQRNKLPVVTDSKNTILWIPGLKKSKFSKDKNEKYDIILKYEVKNR